MQFFPTGIQKCFSRKRVQSALLDSMNEFARLAFRGNEIEPAASDHRFALEAQDVAGYWIAVMMVEEQPAIEFIGA